MEVKPVFVGNGAFEANMLFAKIGASAWTFITWDRPSQTWSIDHAALALAGYPSSYTPTHERTPVDAVVDSLARDGVSRQDRGRLGKALGDANARADGDKAGANEAFGRIAGRVAGGMQTLTGRD